MTDSTRRTGDEGDAERRAYGADGSVPPRDGHGDGAGGDADDGAGDDGDIGDGDSESGAADAGAERVYTLAEVQKAVAAKEAELHERHLRVVAEYQNFRRRVEREKESWADETLEAFARDLLPVIDSFERALALREKDLAAATSGLEIVERQLEAALEKHGMAPIAAEGAFDPRVHEAVMRTPDSDKPAGTVLAVFERGWKMRSRLLRPARVQVASPKE